MKIKVIKFSILYMIWVGLSFAAPENIIKDNVVNADKSHNAIPEDEMSVYRLIAEKKIVSYQDLADILAMQQGKFDKMDPAQRLQELKKYNLCDLENLAAENKPLSRGALAKAILLHYNFEQGLFFAITKWERYAIADIRYLSIMHPKFSQSQTMNGIQLIGALDKALSFSENQTESSQ